MAWNEPGGNGSKDPWSNRGKEGGPPDLDDVVRKMQDKLGGIFGRSGGGGKGGSGGSAPWILIGLALILFLVWEMAYIVQPYERGVVLRFGSHVATLEPGLNFRLPRPIESVTKTDIDQIRTVTHQATMLTEDENIVDVELAIQYRIKNVTDYQFMVRAPDGSLRQVTESALRDAVGASTMDFVLTEGRAQISATSRELLQRVLDQYQTGLLVTSVNMQPAKPPEEVKAAFDDAIKAREDEQRLINEAQAYQNEIIPKARGQAARIIADAQAYKFRVIAEAEGDASRFSQLYEEYAKAPVVTRQRLYLDAIGSVLSKTSKVLLDSGGSNNLLYLPVDKLLEHGRTTNPPVVQPRVLPPVEPVESAPDRRQRERGAR